MEIEPNHTEPDFYASRKAKYISQDKAPEEFGKSPVRFDFQYSHKHI
jgi:hypothetical protein